MHVHVVVCVIQSSTHVSHGGNQGEHYERKDVGKWDGKGSMGKTFEGLRKEEGG